MIKVFPFFSYPSLIVLMSLMVCSLGCVDLDFDEPPPGGIDPNLPVNITIAELKARHVLGSYEEITDDVTFDGLVISDDEEGNFFKQLVISDETGGIEIRIEMNDIHNIYPVGRKVYVKAKGLWLGDYNNLIQLGAGVDLVRDELIRLPESLVDQYLIPATYGNEVVPKTLSIVQLEDGDVSTLIKLEGIQFVASDAGETWADAVLQEALNLEIEDCFKRRLIVRTSGFASFAADLTPEGYGSITGILGVFGDDFQFTIRDLEDVNMTGERCASKTFTIAALRDTFYDGIVSVPAGSITGVVISDFNSQSVTSKNLYLQDATGGITIRFANDHSFALGDEITIDIGGESLSEFNGLLQVQGVLNSNAAFDSHPGDVTPRSATVLEVLTNAQQWESTLVRIDNVTLSGSSTYNGEIIVTDSTGSMILYTRPESSFASNLLPAGVVSITAIVSENFIPQLIIRNLSDIKPKCDDIDFLEESFSSYVDNQDINQNCWANIAVKGTRLWRAKEFAGNIYTQATAFGDTESEMEAWLITPSVTLDEPKKISFESAKAFFTHDGLTVWVSSDFNGSDVAGATWTKLNPVIAQSSDTEHAFIPSGDIDLSGFSGPVRIGFKYVGSGPDGQTTSFRIDNVKIEKR